jgi:hypothetical protein
MHVDLAVEPLLEAGTKSAATLRRQSIESARGSKRWFKQ